MNEIGKTRESFLTGALRTLLTSFRQPLAGHAAVLALSQYFAAGMGLLTVIVATRILGPKEYGVAALAISYPSLVYAIANVKTVSVVTRYVARYRDEGKHDKLLGVIKYGYAFDFLMALLAFAWVLATVSWIARYVGGGKEMVGLMTLYAAAFPLYSLAGASRAVLVCWQKFGLLAVLQAFESLLTLAMVGSLLMAKRGLMGVVWGMALGQAAWGISMAVAATVVLYRGGYGAWWYGSLRAIKPILGEMVSFSGWHYLSVTYAGLMSQCPTILLGTLRGPTEAGFMSLASTLATVSSYLENALARIVYPQIVTVWHKKEVSRLAALLNRWSTKEGVLAGLIIVVLSLLLPSFVPFVFGSSFQESVAGAQLLLTAGCVSAIYFWNNVFYYSVGRARLWSQAYGVLTALTVVLGWTAAHRFGFLGMALTIAMARVAHSLIMRHVAHRILARRRNVEPDGGHKSFECS